MSIMLVVVEVLAVGTVIALLVSDWSDLGTVAARKVRARESRRLSIRSVTGAAEHGNIDGRTSS